MSNTVFPQLPGLAWGTSKKPTWNTRVQKSVSGKRMAVGYMSYPTYLYTVSFNILREFSTYTELEQLQGFFNQMKGQFDTFLFTDPEDCVVSTPYWFGTGNGTNTQYQLTRMYGGFLEPVQSPNIISVTITDWQGTDQPVSSVARTNRILQSQNVSTWGQVNTSTANDVTAAPDGTTTADKVLGTAVTNFHYVDTTTYTPADNAIISASVFLKKGDYDVAAIALYHKGGGSADLNVNLTNGAMVSWTPYTNNGTTATYRIVSVGNGWYRVCIENFPVGTGATAPRLRCYLCDSAGNASFLGNTSLGTFVWGGQIELASTNGRYIATTTDTVTQTDYTVGSTGILTFSFIPPNGAVLKWTGSYYWRCAFTQDTMDLINQDGDRIWKSNKISFETVKV